MATKSQDLDDIDLIFDSPAPPNENTPSLPPKHPKSRADEKEAREAALKQELESLRRINQVIEGVVESLEKAKENVKTVSTTVNSASTLLHTWTRILSQAEHNQRLILNPRWQGASQDIADIENENVRRQQEAQRRQLEEQQRREVAARKAQEDERKKAAGAARGTRNVRGHTRVGSRPTSGASGSTSTAGYSKMGSSGTRGSARAGSSTGRSGGSVGRGRVTRGRGVG
jgi:DASH complex subunit Duo1